MPTPAQRDLLQGSLEALLGKHLPGGVQQRGPVALGIRPQPPRGSSDSRGRQVAGPTGTLIGPW